MLEGPARDPLIVKSLEFLGGMEAPGGWRPENLLPEVALAGRSNVGKSSLLNVLVRRKGMARVSRTPGRTRAIHFYRVNEQFVLVDLPGYGYAKVSKDARASWRPLIEGYLNGRNFLRGLVLLLDIRREMTADDETMLSYLAKIGVPVVIVLTKADKLGTMARRARVAALMRELDLPEDQIIQFSALNGEGRDELAEAVSALVAASPPPPEKI